MVRCERAHDDSSDPLERAYISYHHGGLLDISSSPLSFLIQSKKERDPANLAFHRPNTNVSLYACVVVGGRGVIATAYIQMSFIDYVDDDDAGMWTDGADKHSLLWLPPFLMDGFSKENTIIGILIVDKRFVVVVFFFSC